jgi:DNA modification methylase
LGQEPTVSAFIEHLVMVFREVWRVLAPSGTCWVNIADSYAGSGMGPNGATGNRASRSWPPKTSTGHPLRAVGLKNKDLCLVPQRLAIALREFGWYVRADVIWAKDSGMCESVADRPTRAHEYVWMLTKNEHYYSNMEAVAEPSVTEPGKMRNVRDVWTINAIPFNPKRLGIVDVDHYATMPPRLAERCMLISSRPGDTILDPFAGSGTTLMVAQRLERRAIGIELNVDYVRMIERRTAQPNLWLASQDCEVSA